MSSEKNTPIDSTVPAVMNVDPIPAAAPRSEAGTLLITEAVFGAANSPEPAPFSAISTANCQYVKSIGSSSSPRNVTATSSSPAVARIRAPCRSGQPPGQRPGGEEADRQRQQVDPGPQRRLLEVVPVQRQPDPLQPDDQHELHAAAGDRGQQRGDVAGRERRILNSPSGTSGSAPATR
jgi:hypothetical protein